ncbi:C2 family cysteine protease [Brachybacterium timonense]|uniref:C2 family cysteine protease n=1 Tax=Brachybacterium timonense TaxID=2050896 RepID=UPI00110D6323|nr:C2 family cysteine protease [Brachybacterium timonense]
MSIPTGIPRASTLPRKRSWKRSWTRGALGDCWFLAGLMAVQQTDPKLLSDNITPKGSPPGSDGWTVRLYVDGEWRDISVAPSDLGVNGARNAKNGEPGVLSIYEQAMINSVDGRASAVSADTPAKGLEIITGQRARESDTLGQPSFEEFKQAIDEGRPVTVMTDPIKPIGPNSSELVSAHVYHVSGYDESTGEIILTNPHGPGPGDRPAPGYEVRVKPDDPGFPFDIFMTGIGEG